MCVCVLYVNWKSIMSLSYVKNPEPGSWSVEKALGYCLMSQAWQVFKMRSLSTKLDVPRVGCISRMPGISYCASVLQPSFSSSPAIISVTTKSVLEPITPLTAENVLPDLELLVWLSQHGETSCQFIPTLSNCLCLKNYLVIRGNIPSFRDYEFSSFMSDIARWLQVVVIIWDKNSRLSVNDSSIH